MDWIAGPALREAADRWRLRLRRRSEWWEELARAAAAGLAWARAMDRWEARAQLWLVLRRRSARVAASAEARAVAGGWAPEAGSAPGWAAEVRWQCRPRRWWPGQLADPTEN